MKTLKIDESNALKFYKDATKEFKAVLEDTFGKTFFSQKITDRIQDIDDIWDYLGITENEVIIFKNPKNKIEKRINATEILHKIAEVYNEGTVLDFTNLKQDKYIPYFKKNSSGGWSFSGNFVSWFSAASSSVGLYFKNSDLAINAGKKFEKYYNDYLG